MGRTRRPRSLRLVQTSLVVLILALEALQILACADQPDAVWVSGIYDDGDLDDVLSASADLSSRTLLIPSPYCNGSARSWLLRGTSSAIPRRQAPRPVVPP